MLQRDLRHVVRVAHSKGGLVGNRLLMGHFRLLRDPELLDAVVTAAGRIG